MTTISTPTSFEEFWPYYVSQHQNRTSRRLHFVGTTLAGACLLSTPLVGWPAIPAAAVAGYGMAWVGHLVFEKNKPATWGGPKQVLWSLRGDLRMWTKMVTRTMDAEVERYADVVIDRGVPTNGAAMHAVS